MAVLEVLTYPDPRLKQLSKDVVEIDNEVRHFCADLAETMFLKDGLGLAAIQVGRPQNIFVLNDDGPKFFINPKLTHTSQEVQREREGCLSFPGMFVFIERSANVVMTALDLDGQEFEYKVDGLMARAVQHEFDHCSGLLMIDRLSHLKRQMVLKKYSKR